MYHNGGVRVKGKDDECCGVFFIKSVLYIFNFIFWLSGGGLLGIGLWTILKKHTFVALLTTHTYVATTYMLLATGVIIIIIGFVGCFGAWQENRLSLMTYATFLLLIFLLEAIVGILAYNYESVVHDELTNSLNHTMLDSYKMDTDKTLAIDDMQRTFKCCGAKWYKDWEYSRWLKGNPAHNNTAADSCCITYSDGCAVHPHPNNIYQIGCINKLGMHLREHLVILGAIGMGICCLQIFGIIFACCLAKKIKEYKDQAESYAW